MVDNRSARTGRGGRAARFAAGALVLVFALGGCSAEEALRFGWPKGITPQAESMRELWTGSVIAALAVGVFTWGLIFWAVFRYRKKSDELPRQTRMNVPIEALYTIVPVLVVVVLFYYTAVTETYVNKETENPDVTVSVVAFKWNWQFAYPKEGNAVDGRPVTTVGSSDEIPILVLPTGKRIRFQETSNDVIHSFWVPELLFKRDVIPGHPNSFEISSINAEGAYVGRCAELCGTYHANMNFEIRAVNDEDYRKFIALKKQGKSTAEALELIGEEPYATSTKPFDTSRTANNAGR